MIDINRAKDALIKADAAGDTEGAKALADYIRSNQPTSSPSTFDVVTDALTRDFPASVLGAPVDMAGMITDTARSLYADANRSPQLNPTEYVGGSDWWKNKVFVPSLTDRETYTPQQKYMSDAINFASQAALGGAGLASKARTVQAGVSKAGPMLASLIEPYMTRPGAQIAADVSGAVGAAGGKNIAENQEMGPLGTLLMTILGGAASTKANQGIEDIVRNRIAARPVQLPDGVITTGHTLDDARLAMNKIVTDKESALKNIDNSLQTSEQMGFTEPTLGPASDDVGLSMLEVGQRARTPIPFANKDQRIRTDIANKMNTLSNPNADVTAPQTRSQSLIDTELSKHDTDINMLHEKQSANEQNLQALQQGAEDIVAPITARRGTEGQASRMINEQIGKDTGALGELTIQKNKMFEDAAKGQFFKTSDVQKIVDKVNTASPSLSLSQRELPDSFTKAIKNYPNSQIPAEEVMGLRRDLTSEIKSARSQMDYGRADMLSDLKAQLNKLIDSNPAFEGATKFYKEQYAPRFAEGYGQKFRDLVQRGTGVDGADAENIMDIFTSTKSSKDDLNRIREIVPDQVSFDNAEEMYFDAKLAKKDLNPKSVRTFLADNNDILPERLKTKYNDLVMEMMGNREDQVSIKSSIEETKRTIRDAESAKRTTEGSLRTGPFGKMARADADKYVDMIMSSDDRLKQIDQVVEGFKGDQKALDGFKEAFVRRMQRKIRGTTAANTNLQEVDASGRPVLYSKLTRLFDEDSEALVKIFSPEEMNDLRRVHKLMADQGNLARRANTGSDTVEKLQSSEEQVSNLVKAAINIKFGLVQGGMINRVTRAIADQFFTGKRRIAAEELLTQAALNPRVAKEILNATPLKIENGKTFEAIHAAIAANQTAENTNKKSQDKLTW